jgi:hypothetical protein
MSSSGIRFFKFQCPHRTMITFTQKCGQLSSNQTFCACLLGFHVNRVHASSMSPTTKTLRRVHIGKKEKSWCAYAYRLLTCICLHGPNHHLCTGSRMGVRDEFTSSSGSTETCSIKATSLMWLW